MTTKHLDGMAYAVSSETAPGQWYTVDLGTRTCSCPAGRRGRECKHVQEAMGFAQPREDGQEGKDVQTEKKGKLIKGRYEFGTVASAVQKEIRRGDIEAAVYWGLLLYETAPQYAWKRVLVTAAEDVGFGDPDVVQKVCTMANAWALAKQGSWYVSPHLFTMAVVMLCKAKKSTWVEDLQTAILWPMRVDKENKTGWARAVLPEYEDGHTSAGKARGATWDEWYYDRHVRFGQPVNEYTLKLWKLYPDWKPKLKPGEQVFWPNGTPVDLDKELG